MAPRLSVAVVQGGPSSEAEVSRASAAAVAKALEAGGHAVVRLELDGRLAEALRTGGCDVVFPIVHGAVGEDGCLQGLLEVLELPYVGSSVLASALAMDKVLARKVFALAGIPVAEGASFARDGGASARACAEKARSAVGASLVVKPAKNGSAIGVSRHEPDAPLEAIARAIEAAWAVDEVALVERWVRGRELTCGVLHVPGRPARAFPPTEIVAKADAFYSYEAKYAPGGSVHVCPAPVGERLTARVQALALAAHEALGCRDLSRTDFIVGEGNDEEACTVLELNTLPGFTATSLYPEAAAVAGVPFPELCDQLVRGALERGVGAKNAARPFPGGA